MNVTKSYWAEGYWNGEADARLGLGPLAVSLTSPLPGYADGYRRGYESYVRRQREQRV
jgi:hypothetical protein